LEAGEAHVRGEEDEDGEAGGSGSCGDAGEAEAEPRDEKVVEGDVEEGSREGG